MRSQLSLLKLAADTWHDAAVAMSGNFDHTGFDFNTMTPFDDPRWREPDSAGGVAYLEVLAHHHFPDDPKHLATAMLALDFLENRTTSPLYEMMLPFGVYAAARLNAVHPQSSKYNVTRLLGFTLVDGAQNPTRGGYGMIVGHWGAAGHGAALGNWSSAYRPNPALGSCDALPDQATLPQPAASAASAAAACTAARPTFSCGGFVLNSNGTATLCKPGTFQAVAVAPPDAAASVGHPRGGNDASGLIGGMGGGNHDAGPEGDYAFFGDGAWFAYALAPVPRYAPHLARAVGKWLLSLGE